MQKFPHCAESDSDSDSNPNCQLQEWDWNPSPHPSQTVSRSVNEPLGITNFVHIIYFSGNRSLLRVLPQIYAENKEPVQSRVSDLVRLLPNCESAERNSLLQLLSMIARDRPNVSNMADLLKF